MSWFWGKPKESGLPPPTALQIQRTRQIEALKKCNPSVFELQRDVEYSVSISVYGSSISLHINLPPSFPQEPPVVKVHPPVTHPWVNEHILVTGCPSLNSFTIHSNIGRVIREIVDEFQQNPPSLKPNHPSTYSHAPPSSLPTCPTHYAPPTGSRYSPVTPTLTPINNLQTPLEEKLRSIPAPAAYTFPEMPSQFPELENLSIGELEILIKDDDQIESLISQMSELSTVKDDLKQLRVNNENLARENLLFQPLLEEKKQTLLETFDKMTSWRQNFDSRSRHCEELRSQYEPGNLHVKLRIGTAEAEQTSDNIAEMFLDGKLEVDQFKKRFIESRKLWYNRKTKEERFVNNGWT